MKDYRWIFFGLNISVHEDILWGAVEQNWDIERCTFTVPDSEYTDGDFENVKKVFSQYDVAITHNFSAVVAEVAHFLSKPYICWVYDCPQRALYRNESLYDENIIFLFDHTELNQLKKHGLKNLHYLPLAANIYRTASLTITNEEICKFKKDISFVGNLYFDTNISALINSIEEQSPGITSQLNKYICSWNKNNDILHAIANHPHFIEQFYNGMNKNNIEQYPLTSPLFWTQSILSREITSRERQLSLETLSQHFDTVIYTYETEPAKRIHKLDVKSSVDYETEMYKIFYASKLNLNITLKSIRSGIPQRIFDIMSVGGCVFTNWQEEMDNLFIPGKELIYFHNIDEMRDLANYYLTHEDARTRIGIAGYQRVKKDYNYSVAASKIKHTLIEYLG